ncbi:MAG: PDZ domain-containing protein [Planctomycetes bacterium]|nr:PDZ domain-containing protein [Planctomycetota bacterium]
MTGIITLTLLLTPAAPVPATPPKPVAGYVDRNQALQFSRLVYQLAEQVAVNYVIEKKNHQKELIEAAVRGLYDETGQAIPDNVKAALARSNSAVELVDTLADVRILLGDHPNLTGAKSLFAAMNGFKHATDQICGLYSPRINAFASVDQDFGVGIELEGVVGTRWTLYQVEQGVALGRFGAIGWFGPVVKADALPSPAGVPWKVKRVIPGSPAQRAGVKPGDVITSFNGSEITAETANRLFSQLANPTQIFDPATGRMMPQERRFIFRRGEEKPFTANLKSEAYTPESAFGVFRTADDKWDCMLDRKNKIGYIRLGPIETGLDRKFADLMSELTKQGCRALILDLRWCPGGYVDPGTQIAGMFLKDGSVIAKMEYRNAALAGSAGEIHTPPGGGQYSNMPLVVLVGNETTGGGELITSALRDNDRCVVVGQRTVGRASIQNVRDAGFAGVQFRITTGTSLRPNGKNRQRKPDSQPTDEWGIRPDDGLEVPITADKSAELRRQADLHSLRPADSREALPFDDADADPYRLAALKYLRKKLDGKK